MNQSGNDQREEKYWENNPVHTGADVISLMFLLS